MIQRVMSIFGQMWIFSYNEIMDMVVIFLFVIFTALLAAAALALIKIGAAEVFRYAEARWKGFGAIAIIFCWVIVLPVMVLLSFFVGLYRFITVNYRYFLHH